MTGRGDRAAAAELATPRLAVTAKLRPRRAIAGGEAAHRPRETGGRVVSSTVADLDVLPVELGAHRLHLATTSGNADNSLIPQGK